VLDSVPASEYAETEAKAAVVLRAVAAAEEMKSEI
jgi:anthranilate/para-aminobenzoate synthase component I